MTKRNIFNLYIWLCSALLLLQCQFVRGDGFSDVNDFDYPEDSDDIWNITETISYTSNQPITTPSNAMTETEANHTEEALTTNAITWNPSNETILLDTTTSNNTNSDDESSTPYMIKPTLPLSVENSTSGQMDADTEIIDQNNQSSFELFAHKILENLGCSIDEIEKMLQWSWIPRDNNGYRIIDEPLRVPLPKNGKVYSSIQGISFNNNGSFNLHLVEVPSGDKNALFNSDDVELIMGKGLTDVSLSLHQMSQSNLLYPFQKATWSPHDDLHDTNFLATLLHVDVWLQSIILPTEMSAKSPFRVRNVDQGINLPSSLYYRLFHEHGLHLDKTLLPVTQLWIRSNPIKYNRTMNRGNVTYLLGAADLQFDYRDLFKASMNNLTGNMANRLDDDASWHDAFITALKTNYQALLRVVPELQRLGELNKLSAVSLLFQHHYQMLAKSMASPSVEFIEETLNSEQIQSQIFDGRWFLLNDERIEREINETIANSSMRTTGSRVILRENVRRKVFDLQQKKIREVIDLISHEFNITKNSITVDVIHAYLSKNDSDAKKKLINEIIEGIEKRLGRSPPPEAALFQTMSRSGYKIQNAFDDDPIQLDRKEKNTRHNSSNETSCDSIIPMINTRTLRHHQDDQFQRDDVKLFASLRAVPIADLYPTEIVNETYSPLPLGSLSIQYESGGRGPGTITTHKKSKTSGYVSTSYGTYQLDIGTGSLNSFRTWLHENYPNAATGLNRFTPGTFKFNFEWKKFAKHEPIEFRRLQHEFIKRIFYDTTIAHLSKRYQMNLMLDIRSPVIQDVIWSTSFQHGPVKGATIIQQALKNQNLEKITDREMIDRIYAERGADGGRKYFNKNSDQTARKSVLNRFRNEKNDALKRIQE